MRDLTALEYSLTNQKLTFCEYASRMNYGMIGHLISDGKIFVLIYKDCFYIQNKNKAVGKDLLICIDIIQRQFAELTRDEKNKITTITIGLKSPTV